MYEKIIDFTKPKQFYFTNYSARRNIGIAMSFAPMISLVAAFRFICLIFTALFKELEIPITGDEVSKVAPSTQLLSDIVNGTAAEVIHIARDKCKYRKLFMAMDAANKNGTHHMVKVISMWDFPQDRLFIFTLDADACKGTDEKTAEAVDDPLKKLDHPEYRTLINGLATDDGGGWVGGGLQRTCHKVPCDRAN